MYWFIKKVCPYIAGFGIGYRGTGYFQYTTNYSHAFSPNTYLTIMIVGFVLAIVSYPGFPWPKKRI